MKDTLWANDLRDGMDAVCESPLGGIRFTNIAKQEPIIDERSGDPVRSVGEQRQAMARCLLLRLRIVERQHEGWFDKGKNYLELTQPGFTGTEVNSALILIDAYMSRHGFTTANGLYKSEILDVCFDALEQQKEQYYAAQTATADGFTEDRQYIQQELFADAAGDEEDATPSSVDVLYKHRA